MKTFRAGSAFVAAGVILIPIERWSVDSWTGPFRCHASKEVFAVVYRGPSGLLALDMEGGEKPIKELIKQVPELASLMEGFEAL